MTQNTNLWQAKTAARLHDPAEKALVLFRDPKGHEGGTSKELRDLFGLDEAMEPTVTRADWWAAAGDRPKWPSQNLEIRTKTGETKTIKSDDFSVRWYREPVLIHPLTGQKFDLRTLFDGEIGDIKAGSLAHHKRLHQKTADGTTDWQKTLLALWRFAPEKPDNAIDIAQLGALWHLLPADTRIPDHSIWDHLDLTSAFVGAFSGDENGEAALLTMSIGPVQSFRNR
ncbi:MAG: hypothetical protein LBU43_00590 [Candidatus Accumulibacter sp.]|jgi:CRISPR-associated protein Cmr2|nr:hypothetical protein [Accumulibacter sp.]